MSLGFEDLVKLAESFRDEIPECLIYISHQEPQKCGSFLLGDVDENSNY